MGWDYLTCVHGKREGLDSHDCPECLEIAKECNYDTSKGQTYIFTSKKQIENCLKESKNEK